MNLPFLCIESVQRRLATGNVEMLVFEPGVNVLVGRPNTGKTKWLQTLDYLLGDAGGSPFEGSSEDHLSDKYDAASAAVVIGNERLVIERRWRETGAKTKVFVNGAGMAAPDLQRLLMEKLGIPVLHFPRGNPMSGQTWPELSFRTLLRHIYRRQSSWASLAEQQPETEQHACLLQFLGLAERLYTQDYGALIKLKMQSERLRARRDQYGATLSELAGDVLTDPGLQVAVTQATVTQAEARFAAEVDRLRSDRTAFIEAARDTAIPSDRRGRVEQLGEQRSTLLVALEGLKRQVANTSDRLADVRRYRAELGEEIDRMTRAEDAGALLADLRITHCPACDQPVFPTTHDHANCFLCHQHLPSEPNIDGLGAARVRFELDRLSGEFKEAESLLAVLQREASRLAGEVSSSEERLRSIEDELAPAKLAVSSLVQAEVSAIDMQLGQISERQRQVGRLKGALELGERLTEQIKDVEREIEPLQARVDEAARAADFGEAETKLADGMNEYLAALNALRPGVWGHSRVRVDITRSSFRIDVGVRRWSAALGGTDTLYFLMAYQYGLLRLSDRPDCHYPGLAIIDVPGDFSGEAVEDKENFIVQPFIELLARDTYKGAQVIITGASFVSLEGAHRQRLTEVHVS